MRAVITVEMDGKAFQVNPWLELGRILRETAERGEQSGSVINAPITLHDTNGHPVGVLTILDDETDLAPHPRKR